LSEPFVEFAPPDYGDAEIAAVAEVLRSGWTTTGPRTAAFEKAFRECIGAPHALAVSSGTAAIHLALTALGLAPGDEVITTPLTFCATVNAILQTGATPVLADVGDDLNLSPDAIRRAVTPRTRCILPVHLAGLPCDLEGIWKIAAEHRLFVVEDAAHAAGASACGVRVGAGASDAVAFSFYATKNLSTGEGGMVTCRDAALRERMRVLSLHGMRPAGDSWSYDVVECGFKYNMSDIMAAIGLVQLARLDEMNRRRAEIARAYNNAFAEMVEVELPPGAKAGGHAWQLYILRLNLDRLRIDRARFIAEMRQCGIACSVHFKPVPLHSYYRERIELRDPCTRALAEYPRLVSLPMSSRLNDDEVARVIAAVRDICS